MMSLRESAARRTAVPRAEARWFSSDPLRRIIEASRADGHGTRTLAALTGLSRRTLQRALARERLRSDSADNLAGAFGRHPSELWPNWFGEGDDD